MLITETAKASALPQSENTTNTGAANITNNANATTNVFSSSTTSAPNTGTPLRSRNRGDKQSEDKSEYGSATTSKGKNPPKPPDEFYRDLQLFHEKRGTIIRNIPRITGREVDLHRLYCEVTERGGFLKVNSRDQWDEVLQELGWKEKIVNGSAGLKFIYRRYLEKYERVNYFGEDPEKIDAMEAAEMAEFMGGRGGSKGSSRYPSSVYGGTGANPANNVAMTYNYKQHHVNMDRRRQFKLSTDLHKSSPYEKLLLSLLSPLPNEQDFAINACTLMANESKHTLKVNEYPKLVDALLAHTGVYSDYTMRKLFQHVYNGVRKHSLYGFWYDLLHDQPQILDLYTDEHTLRDSGIIDDFDNGKQDVDEDGLWNDCKDLYFLNLRRGLGTYDYVGQRVLQVVTILRNLSFFPENLQVLVKNKTLLRFLVMSSNIRWSNVHIQALEITGNIAMELDLADPTVDDLSRCLMATICDGIDGPDRGVIINCLEILYKLCQREANEDYVLKCLNAKFYNTITQFLSLNDIMLLIFTLEAIYALTCLGPKSCNSMMQIRGIVDQLISLISVEAQSYGTDGCILMRVVETVPGNMLPMVAQNIANLQNAVVIQKSNNPHPVMHKPQIISNQPPPPSVMIGDMNADGIPPFHHSAGIAVAPVEKHHHPQAQQQQPHPHITPAPTSQMSPQNFTHDDEQYALAWLGATFERTPSNDSHIEQQELYRMYLSHCQKAGKHSVVNHMQFPRLVKLIFTNAVGPAMVRKTDGTDLPGQYYVSIRLRAQPLPLQQKSNFIASGPNSPAGKQMDNSSPARKVKKKIKVETTTSGVGVEATTLNTTSTTTSVGVENVKPVTTSAATVGPGSTASTDATETTSTNSDGTNTQSIDIKCEEKMDIEESEANTKMEEASSGATQSQVDGSPAFVKSPQATTPSTQTQSQSSQTSLIKSLLANKVNQRQQKQKDSVTATTSNPNTTTSNIITTTNSSPLTQPTVPAITTEPIKVPSTAITALVNNPLMQNTPVKVGQTTIKPLNPQLALEKKHISESTPPPLAPLSGANVAKDASGRPILLANQMLVDILDKKMIDPPLPSAGLIQKRKLEEQGQQNKRMAGDPSSGNLSVSKEETPVTPSKNAANLYAEMAASILEDEDLEELAATQTAAPPPKDPAPSLTQPSLIVQQTTTTGAMPRQLVFQTSQQPQIKINQTPATVTQPTMHQMPNAMATIKTDQGLQTVPVIVHQKPMVDNSQPQQIIQQVMQPTTNQAPTQYVLATNQQGQTYLVAQQAPQPPPQPQPTQTVLVTQTPQQQSTGAKTIIILQQNTIAGPPVAQQQIITTTTQGQQQKMIMTTPQGQQVLVTQRPQTPQQIFINPQTGAATHIQPRQIIQTATPPSVAPTISTQAPQQGSTQIQAGQMSPSLLNQLNQIPATIKLHQPIPQTASNVGSSSGPGGISRINTLNKGVSIVQQASTPPTPVAIPQLQQHQSIIQQHIISGPSTEKRHVILGAGRAIEIKETVITQTQPPPQQCQLNPQTIITTQHPQQQQQQVQKQIRAVIEQQQQHPSIIQQKISSFSVMPQSQLQQQQQQHQQQHHSQQQQQHLQFKQQQHHQSSSHINPSILSNVVTASAVLTSKAPELLAAKPTESAAPPPPSLIANQAPAIVTNQNQSIKKSILASTPPPPTLIKPSLPTVKLPPNLGSGPPPLAAVNSSSNNSAAPTTAIPFTNVSNPTTSLLEKDSNKKEDSMAKAAVGTTSFITPAASSTSSAGGGGQTPNTSTTSNATNAPTTVSSTSSNTSMPAVSTTPPQVPASTPQATVAPQTSVVPQLTAADAQWLFICDWRNCPRKKFKSLSDLQHHVCTQHAPDHLDASAEIFCQWGIGPGLCDGIPRKRFSLMTHLIDRHLTVESLRAAVQRRIATGAHNIAPSKPPVTIVRNIELSQRTNTSSPSSSSSSSHAAGAAVTGSSALQAIKRHTADFMNSKELMDENEGPVTKSIRLTAALILRNLVIYTTTAKRSIRRYEPHLANIALSNVESSGTISHILYELNN
ncbi:AT-rich interactive domain-containing protein 2 [Musca vetustissima]|uniref:AT-rich interactive domain-containing protein 2 n=1 Tax=Musca vetustissima TaxID=27455 RepID=UPI002AB73775|nr:AT-rich interactive domain-containing protein 2 [Musca vetustissima]